MQLATVCGRLPPLPEAQPGWPALHAHKSKLRTCHSHRRTESAAAKVRSSMVDCTLPTTTRERILQRAWKGLESMRQACAVRPRGEDAGEMGERAERVWAWIAAAHADDAPVSVAALCRAAVLRLGVDGAGVTATSGPVAREPSRGGLRPRSSSAHTGARVRGAQPPLRERGSGCPAVGRAARRGRLLTRPPGALTAPPALSRPRRSRSGR